MMKNKTIKFALIGCGAIAHKHVAAVNGLENGEIVGAYDVNQEAGQVFSKKYALFRNNIVFPHCNLCAKLAFTIVKCLDVGKLSCLSGFHFHAAD